MSVQHRYGITTINIKWRNQLGDIPELGRPFKLDDQQCETNREQHTHHTSTSKILHTSGLYGRIKKKAVSEKSLI